MSDSVLAIIKTYLINGINKASQGSHFYSNDEQILYQIKLVFRCIKAAFTLIKYMSKRG